MNTENQLIIPFKEQRLRKASCLAVACLLLISLSCTGKKEKDGRQPTITVPGDRDQLRSFLIDHRSTFAGIDNKVRELKDWATRRAHDESWLYPNAPAETRVINECSVERDVADSVSHQLEMLDRQVNELRLTDSVSKDISAQLSRELSDRSRLMGNVQREIQAASDEIIQHAGRIPENLFNAAGTVRGYSALESLSDQFVEKLKSP